MPAGLERLRLRSDLRGMALAPRNGPRPCAAPASASDATAPRSLADREARIAGNGSTGPYSLGETLVIPGTERVTRGDRVLIGGLDYTIDNDSGLITLSQSLLAGQEIHAVFQVVPFRLEPRYALREPGVEAPAAAVVSQGFFGGGALVVAAV